MNDEEEKQPEVDEYDDIEEDEELINFLNEGMDDYEIDDEYIYHPGEDSSNEINLEDEAEIDEEFIIETDINEKLPFFSKVNLMLTAQELERMHFKYSVCLIRKQIEG